MANTSLEVRTFSTPKRGHKENENEDKSFSLPLPSKGGLDIRLALSDGATEAAFSAQWAKELVESDWPIVFAEPLLRRRLNFDKQIDSWLTATRSTFSSKIDPSRMPWYAQAKMEREGAFATFLGVRLTHGRGGRRWSAFSCGDTCVLQIRNGRIEESFPVSQATAFGNRPPLVPSNDSCGVPAFLSHFNRKREIGDAFVLATDAVAMWLLADDATNKRIAELLDCQDSDTFTKLIREQRNTGALKNDDSTVIIVNT